MLDLHSGGGKTKPQLKAHKLNPLQLHGSHHYNSLTYYLNLHPVETRYSNQPNLIVDSGLHPSLHLVWNYNKTNIEGIRNLLSLLIEK